MAERIPQTAIDSRLAYLKSQKVPQEIIQGIIRKNEDEVGYSFSDDDRVSLWQFGQVNMVHDNLVRKGDKFLLRSVPCGFMVNDEGDVEQLTWTIRREEYYPTLSLLARIGMNIYSFSFTRPELKKTAHEIVDFTKGYYRE